MSVARSAVGRSALVLHDSGLLRRVWRKSAAMAAAHFCAIEVQARARSIECNASQLVPSLLKCRAAASCICTLVLDIPVWIVAVLVLLTTLLLKNKMPDVVM